MTLKKVLVEQVRKKSTNCHKSYVKQYMVPAAVEHWGGVGLLYYGLG